MTDYPKKGARVCIRKIVFGIDGWHAKKYEIVTKDKKPHAYDTVVCRRDVKAEGIFLGSSYLASGAYYSDDFIFEEFERIPVAVILLDDGKTRFIKPVRCLMEDMEEWHNELPAVQ